MKIKLLLILLLAAFLRFYRLGEVPGSPDWDEAALGYNAYSIMQTGKDEYGKTLPLILRSFDDYKPAVYAYLTILPVKLFGLNVFAVRFPAAFLGTLAVLAVFLLIKEISKNNQLSLLTALVLAISPWHLQFSRIAFESNVGLFVDILVALFFLKGLRKPPFLLISAFFAGLNLYVYQAEKVFTPVLVLVLLIVWGKELINKTPRRYLVSACLVGILLTLPLVYQAKTTPEIFLRAKGTSLAADQTNFLSDTVKRLARDRQNNDFVGVVLDNRRLTYFKAYLNNYMSHFDFNWLFITGDEARHHAPGMGLFYLWELPFLLFGAYSLLVGNLGRKEKFFIFFWLLLAPFPASFSSGAPHAVRSLRMMPIMQLLTASGLLGLYHLMQKRPVWIKSLASLVFVGAVLFNSVYYLNQYYVQQNYYHAKSWQYGYQETVAFVSQVEHKYQKIIVSNQPHLDQSYMFFLFYLHFDPNEYLHGGGTRSGGFAEEHAGFGKYTFRSIDWTKESKDSSILYVGRPQDFPADAKVIKVIKFPDNEEAFRIVEG